MADSANHGMGGWISHGECLAPIWTIQAAGRCNATAQPGVTLTRGIANRLPHSPLSVSVVVFEWLLFTSSSILLGMLRLLLIRRERHLQIMRLGTNTRGVRSPFRHLSTVTKKCLSLCGGPFP